MFGMFFKEVIDISIGNFFLMKITRYHLFIAFFLMIISAIPFRVKLQRQVVSVIQVLRGKKTVAERVAQYGGEVRRRLAASFQSIGVSYPPEKMTLVAIKQNNLLEVWVSHPPRLLKTYPILRASGDLGPK